MITLGFIIGFITGATAVWACVEGEFNELIDGDSND